MKTLIATLIALAAITGAASAAAPNETVPAEMFVEWGCGYGHYTQSPDTVVAWGCGYGH